MFRPCVALRPQHYALLVASAVGGAGCGKSTPLETRAQAAATASAATPMTPPWSGPTVSTDVLVVGGTPSGVAAALAAARQGVRVVLIEEQGSLGGDITFALLNMFDVPMRPNGTSPVAAGIFGEIFRPLGIGFDVGKARDLLEAKIKAQPNITLWKRTRVAQVFTQGRRATGAVVQAMPGARNPALPATKLGVRAKVVIDASNDATYAARAGAGFYVGRQAGGYDTKQQAAGLLFEVKGADWNAMRRYVGQKAPMHAASRIGQEYASDVAPTTSKEVAAVTAKQSPRKPVNHRLGGVDGNYIWERGDVIKKYVPRGRDVVVLSINFGRQSDGTVILNTINSVNVNGLDGADKEQARQDMSHELTTFLPYLRQAMPGMQNAQLVRIAPQLYIRETRHLRGLYELQLNDVRGAKRFPDRITIASYPLDLHPYVKGQVNPFGPKRYYYTLPVRSLLPITVDGLFVASRCLSASYEAAGSARVIPITMGAGQASGVAAALCVKQRLTPHQMRDPRHYQRLQNVLRSTGANIGDKYPTG